MYFENLEFDSQKRTKTLEERGLDFNDVPKILKSSHVYTQQDLRKEYGEQRFITIGYLDDRLIVFVWTMRGKNLRIISMRKANEREQKFFHSKMVQR